MTARLVWPFAAMVCVVLTIDACGRAPVASADASSAVTVTVAVARIDTLRDAVTAAGTVMPSPTGDFTVYAPEAAEIVDLPKKEQDPVVPGDVLVRFEIPSFSQDLATAQLDVLDATAKADRARSELARQTSLFERGITSRNAYDATKMTAAAADSTLAQLKAKFDAIQAGQDRTIVRSRFSGIVTRVWHARGDAVRPGADDPILRVIDPSHVQVSVQLPIAQMTRVLPGQDAIVDAATGGNAESARVVTKVAATDPAAVTGEIRLAFINPATLPVDTPVNASIVFDQRTGALVIPAATVGRDGLGSFVMVAGDDLKAHRRDIRIGLVTKELAQVTGGLSAGERVIVTGAADVAEGTSIVLAQR